MFKVSSILTDTAMQSLSPLADYSVNDTLVIVVISRATCLIDWQRLWGLFRTRFTNMRIIIIIISIIVVPFLKQSSFQTITSQIQQRHSLLQNSQIAAGD